MIIKLGAMISQDKMIVRKCESIYDTRFRMQFKLIQTACFYTPLDFHKAHHSQITYTIKCVEIHRQGYTTPMPFTPIYKAAN